MPLLPFAQLDLAGALAIADGRYLVRPPGDPDGQPDVFVLRTLGAARSRGRLRRGRPVALESSPDALPLQMSRLTLIKAIPFDDEAAASSWLEKVVDDDDLSARLMAEVTRTANRALIAHRVAAPQPYAGDIHPTSAVAMRFGYGSGDEVAEGRWSAAAELPESRGRSVRAEMIDSVGAQERIAAVLGGREEVAAHETLLVDAERAEEQGRRALSALTLAAAMESLRRSGADDGGASAAAGTLAERALSGAEIEAKALREALRAARRAIRAA